MGISLEQYRARIGCFAQGGSDIQQRNQLVKEKKLLSSAAWLLVGIWSTVWVCVAYQGPVKVNDLHQWEAQQGSGAWISSLILLCGDVELNPGPRVDEAREQSGPKSHEICEQATSCTQLNQHDQEKAAVTAETNPPVSTTTTAASVATKGEQRREHHAQHCCLLLYRIPTWGPIFLFLGMFRLAASDLVAVDTYTGMYNKSLVSSCIHSIPMDSRNISVVHEFYVEHLKERNDTDAIWLPIERRDLGGWYWLSGELEEQTEWNRGYCVAFQAADMVFEEHYCDQQLLKYLCQKTGSTCKVDGSNCFVYAGIRYTIVIERGSWYEARGGCYERGEQLASLPKANRQRLQEKIREMTPRFPDIWIGLRRVDHYVITGNTSVDTYYWRKEDACPCNSPHSCVALQRTKKDGFFWTPRSCLDSITSIVCDQKSRPEEFTTNGQVIPETGERVGLAVGVLVAVVVVVMLVLVVLVVLLACFLWHKWRKKGTNPVEEENGIELIDREQPQANNIIRDVFREISTLKDLMIEEVISHQDELKLRKIQYHREQVLALLNQIQLGGNRVIRTFFDMLHQQGYLEVVGKYLLTPGDFLEAKRKMIEFILKEFRDDHLYSVEEPYPISLDRIYVEMEWRRCTGIHGQMTIPLDSYLDIIPQMRKEQETRVVVSGVPGGGKTTFIKHIALEWAKHAKEHQSYVENNNPVTDTSNCQETGQPEFPQRVIDFQIIIPIILRLIESNSSFLEILQQQFSGFTIRDAMALDRFLNKNEHSSLILLDGYDELNFYEVIHKIMGKEMFSSATVMCTTRPHGVTLIRRLGTNAIGHELLLCGFNQKQIQMYINQFFEIAKLPKESGEVLFRRLTSDRIELLPMAQVPIQLQMICVVWSHNNDLGEHIVDLYAKFEQCLTNHMEKKLDEKRKEKKYAVDAIDYVRVLEHTKEIAYTWNKQDMLEHVFFYDSVMKLHKSDIENIIKCGFLVKYHPATLLQKSNWSFIHLTVQEYFVAKYLTIHVKEGSHSGGKCSCVPMPFKHQLEFLLPIPCIRREEDQAASFIRRCSSVQRLQRLTMVFRFLCGLNPRKANKILSPIIKRIEGEEECKQLLRFLLDLVAYYRDPQDVDLPLPQHVILEENVTHLLPLMKSDAKEKHRNMKALTIRKDTEMPESGLPTMDLSYINKLVVTIDSNYSRSVSHSIIPRMGGLKKVCVNADKTNREDLESCMNDLPNETVQQLEISMKNNVNISKIGLDQFSNLSDCVLLSPMDDLQQFASTVRLCPLLEKVSVITQDINADLLLLPPVKLNLTCQQPSVRGIESFIQKCSSGHDQVDVKVQELYINKCDDLRWKPGTLGVLLLVLPTLQLLQIRELSTEMVQRSVPKLGQTALHTIAFRTCALGGGGAALGQLLGRCPYLHTLEMYKCKMRGEDMEQMAANMPGSTSITRLRLAGNDLRGGEAAAGRLLQHTPQLQLLDMSSCGIHIPDLLKATRREVVANLWVVDLGAYIPACRNTDEHMEVSTYLASMPRLQALSVEDCGCMSVPALLRLITSLPDTLTHLNLCDNDFGATVVEVTKHKERLSRLHRLNIGMMDQQEEREAIREELQQLNPDLRVYYKRDERLWDMYKNATFDD